MKASIFESRKPQAAITEAELAAQKAAFFASGKKPEQVPFGESAEKYLNRRQMNQEAWRLSQVSEKRKSA
jgi:hypothetical protein